MDTPPWKHTRTCLFPNVPSSVLLWLLRVFFCHCRVALQERRPPVHSPFSVRALSRETAAADRREAYVRWGAAKWLPQAPASHGLPALRRWIRVLHPRRSKVGGKCLAIRLPLTCSAPFEGSGAAQGIMNHGGGASAIWVGIGGALLCSPHFIKRLIWRGRRRRKQRFWLQRCLICSPDVTRTLVASEDVHTFFSCSLFALSFFTNLLMVTFGNIAVLWLFPLDKNNALGLFATLNERWQVERWQRSALVTCLPSLAQGFAGGRSYREMRRDFTSAPKVANNHTEKHCSYLPFVAFDKSRCGGLKSRQIHRQTRQLGIAACLVEASWFELRRPEKTSVSATATICPFLIVSAVGSIRFLTTASKTSHNCTVLINCWSGFTEELPIVCEGLFPPFGQSGSLVAVSLHCITKYIVHSHILPTSAFLDYTLTMSWHSFVSEIFKDFFSFLKKSHKKCNLFKYFFLFSVFAA